MKNHRLCRRIFIAKTKLRGSVAGTSAALPMNRMELKARYCIGSLPALIKGGCRAQRSGRVVHRGTLIKTLRLACGKPPPLAKGRQGKMPAADRFLQGDRGTEANRGVERSGPTFFLCPLYVREGAERRGRIFPLFSRCKGRYRTGSGRRS